MSSSDGKTRDLVTPMPGAGWDFSLSRHPYHMIERPFGPHYCVQKGAADHRDGFQLRLAQIARSR